MVNNANSTDKPDVKLAPPPQWVQPHLPNTKQDQSPASKGNGLYYLLVDRQIDARNGFDRFQHYAFKLANEDDVDENSSISVSFSPNYQTLTFHTVQIWRDGSPIQKLNKSDIKLLQREKRLEELIYDGRWTASLIVEDVRKGDVLEYSYTLSGDNPAFNGEVSHLSYLQWSADVGKSVSRLLWPNDKQLSLTKNNLEHDINITEHDGYKEYTLISDYNPVLRIDTETPKWFDPWARVNYSSVTQWSSVVDWAVPHYKLNKEIGTEVAFIAKNIRNKYKGKSEQVSAALHFVQDDIRYMGIEIGVGGFIPSSPDITLNRRYGDCKDKTFLLLNILKLLEVEAYPVLANTESGENLGDDGPRLDAFNHVLATAIVDGKNYWLDPTINSQKGLLDNIHQPDYGLALVVKKGNNSLTSMALDQKHDLIVYNDEYDLRNGINKSSTFTVTTIMSGEVAESFRRQLNSDGKTKIFKSYLNFYNYYYSNIEAIVDAKISDSHSDNRITVKEEYRIPAIWEENSDENSHEAFFYTYSIKPHLKIPKVVNRSSPFVFSYPLNIEHNIKVLLADEWDLEDESFQLKTRFFNYSHKVSYDEKEKILILKYKFSSLKKYIHQDDITEYIDAIEKVKDQINFGVTQGSEINKNESWYSGIGITTIILSLVIISLIFTLIEFISDRKNSPAHENIHYYPVSSAKVFILSIATLGIYLIYWFYKNWVYVKARDKSSIIPWGRALFYGFWMYPLYLSLSREDFYNGQDVPKYRNLFYGFLAFGFLVGSALSGIDDVRSYAALLISIVCLMPLVEMINRITLHSNEYYVFNSRWRPRHLIFIIFGSVLISYHIASSINYIPNNLVISGSSLWSRDIKFMQRIKVLDPEEKLILFYSAGDFSFKEDGNGISDRGVFSYWKDELNGKIISERASFDEISDFVHTLVSDDLSSIKIVKKDGSNFILFVTTNNGGDKKFTKRLKEYWTINKIISPEPDKI
ncbi:MAG: DUF3857 domain-containing protein [Arenicellales bacterium]